MQMSNDAKWIIGSMIVLGGLITGLISAQIAGVNTRIDDLQTELNGRIDDLRTELNGRIDDLRTELTTRMDGLDARMDRLDGRMDRLETRMGRIEARMDGIDQRLRNVEIAFGRVAQRLLTIERVVLPAPEQPDR